MALTASNYWWILLLISGISFASCFILAVKYPTKRIKTLIMTLLLVIGTSCFIRAIRLDLESPQFLLESPTNCRILSSQFGAKVERVAGTKMANIFDLIFTYDGEGPTFSCLANCRIKFNGGIYVIRRMILKSVLPEKIPKKIQKI